LITGSLWDIILSPPAHPLSLSWPRKPSPLTLITGSLWDITAARLLNPS